MIVADTSIWIEFLKAKEPIYSIFEEKLNAKEIIGVECVFGELLQGCRNEEEISIVRQYWENITKVDEIKLFIQAGEYSSRNNLIAQGVGLIDSAIFTLTIRGKAKIWSLDKKLLKLFKENDIFKP